MEITPAYIKTKSDGILTERMEELSAKLQFCTLCPRRCGVNRIEGEKGYCGGYESLEILKLLDGIIDIYMPDIKFMTNEVSLRYCNAPDYPERVAQAVMEMQRQVGDLIIDENGIARRGLLIRHLVMPVLGNDTRAVLTFIRDNISEDAFVNITAQYHPCYRAHQHSELSRRLIREEHASALGYAREIGLKRAYSH